jgi:multicomponent Na+:H+ antiporter subunit D
MLMVVPTAVLVVLGAAMGIAGAPIWALSERAAADLLDPTAYIRSVLAP